MTATALRHERDEVFQEIGTVTHVAGATVMVATPVGVVRAERAHSCLTTPRPDDEVIVATSTRSGAWVLAVLTRGNGEDDTVVEVSGDLAIRCRHGRLDLGARQGMSLTSAEDLTATAGALRVRAVDGDVALSRLAFVSRYVMSEVERVRCVAKTLDSHVGRFTQRVKQSFRIVEEIDRLEAAHVDHCVEGTASLRSKNTVFTAEQLVKLDGGQIHLG